MKRLSPLRYLILIGMLFYYAFAKAQLQFCEGTLGAPIFTEDFGQGTTNGPALPATVTSYTYVNGGTQDGEYTISNDSGQLSSWFSAPDHTGNTNGKMLIVNAGFSAGQFYRTPVNGLCENTPYEFSAWIMNVFDGNQNICGTSEIPIQVRFEIWDATDTTLLASGTMTPRFSDMFASWVRYGLTFTTTAGQNGVVLKMINVGAGGCGNDLAIDDISFSVCGDSIVITDPIDSTLVTKCDYDVPVSTTLTATAITTNPQLTAFQWQESSDGVVFTDITGATGNMYTTPLLSSTTFYRVKAAGDAVNFNNSNCFVFSDVFEFRNVIVPLAVPRQDPFISCDGVLVDMIVDVTGNTAAYWYDTPTGGVSLHDDSIDYTTTVEGTYWVETIDVLSGCVSDSRVPVNFVSRNAPVVNSEDFVICPDEEIVLDTQFTLGFYQWSSGASTQSITVNQAGQYTCLVTNLEGCDATATFNVDVVEVPVISGVEVVQDEMTVISDAMGDFLYSIDGINYSNSSVFDISDMLQVTVYMKDVYDCNEDTYIFNRIEIPAFFTPNNDGYHDTWEIYNISSFPQAKLEIFDRYGKLLQQINNLVVGWDGRYLNQPMPSDDYWYRLYYNDIVITGHFALKR